MALLLLVFPAPAQVATEELAEMMEGIDEVPDDELAEQLSDWERHPLDINRARAEDLRRFRVISDLQIGYFLQYREKLGPFIDLHELQAVPGWPVGLLKKILPYLTVKSQEMTIPGIKRQLTAGDHLLLARWGRMLEQAKGYQQPKIYAGSCDQLLIKYKYKYRDLLQYGFTAEKDAGEAMKKGFDFYSFHLFIRTGGWVRQIAMGDYSINLGQGLVQWNGMGAGKGAEVIQVKQQAEMLRPYSSSMESNFQRGLAAVLEKGRWQGLVFLSALRVSGNMADDTSSALTSIALSGLHRTQAELEDRKNTRLVKAGSHLNFRTGALRAGINVMMSTVSKPFNTSPSPHRALMPRESRSLHYSSDLSYTWRNMHLFGEAAFSGNAPSILLGAMASVDRKAELALLFRQIHPRYHAPAANAFTESSTVSNETGFYAGLSIRPVQPLEIKVYTDLFHFPFLRYRQNGPAWGSEAFLQLHFRPSKHAEIYFRWKTGEKMQNSAPAHAIAPLVAVQQQHLRLHFSCQFSSNTELRGRTDISFYKKEEHKEHGYLSYVEGRFRLSGNIRLQLRLQSFETTGYNSRIYAYEQDLPYASALPSFAHAGVRYYFVVNKGLGQQLECSMKWAQTIYSNLSSSGSGAGMVEGNRRSEIRLQVLVLFPG